MRKCEYCGLDTSLNKCPNCGGETKYLNRAFPDLGYNVDIDEIIPNDTPLPKMCPKCQSALSFTTERVLFDALTGDEWIAGRWNCAGHRQRRIDEARKGIRFDEWGHYMSNVVYISARRLREGGYEIETADRGREVLHLMYDSLKYPERDRAR